MVERYFNMSFCFDKQEVYERIKERLSQEGSDYITVADGVVLNTVNRMPSYQKVTDGAMFSICDSSFVPLYIKWIYGKKYQQFTGSMIFKELVSERQYRMFFLGTNDSVLAALKKNLSENFNPDCRNMTFMSLPFMEVNDFDYFDIAKKIEDDKADIIWVSLGAPKQDIFMSLLKPHLSHGVMMGVGAAFKFYSGLVEKRAPAWMIKNHLEFVYRIFQDPKKQLKRCGWIVYMLPKMLIEEINRKNKTNKL